MQGPINDTVLSFILLSIKIEVFRLPEGSRLAIVSVKPGNSLTNSKVLIVKSFWELRSFPLSQEFC